MCTEFYRDVGFEEVVGSNSWDYREKLDDNLDDYPKISAVAFGLDLNGP
jgi:hypothetical protein